MRRIVITTFHSLHPITHGGIVRVIEEARFLSENSFEVHLIGNKTNGRGLKRVEEKTRAKAYTYSRRDSRILYSLQKILDLANPKIPGQLIWAHNPFIKNDIDSVVKKVKPDIIQCEFIHTAYQVSQIAKKYGIPFVMAEHNVESVRLVEEGVIDKKYAEKLKKFERDLCNSADFVTTVSEEDKQKLEEIGVHAPIKIVPNGVDYYRYQISIEVKDKMRQKYGIQKNDTILVFHGSLDYRPNADADNLLIEYVFPELDKKYKNLKLLLIGPGHLKKIGKKIIQLPTIPFDEFPEHLSMGDIGVVPLYAGSGTRLKIIEYLALGIPTVSTEIGARGLPVTDNENIIIAKSDKGDFVGKTIRLLEDEELQEKLRKNGNKLAKEKLDWNIVLRKYLEIYDYLV